MIKGERQIRIAILIAVFNRWNETKALLDSLGALELENVDFEVWVCSDGSTDETDSEILRNYPKVKIIQSNGKQFWAKSMNQIDVESFKSKPDFTLWLNNDTTLNDNFAVQLQGALADSQDRHIFVGSLCDPLTLETTYTGCVHRERGKRDEFRFIPPLGVPVEIGMFSGNVVLIPRSAREKLGPISSTFSHGWADMDYGMRAKRQGIKSYLMASHVGTGTLNPLYSKHANSEIPLGSRLRHAFGRKGYQPIDYAKFCFRALPPRRAMILFTQNIFRIFLEALLAKKKS